MLERRSFLSGVGALLITAPAIVRAASLMPVKNFLRNWTPGTYYIAPHGNDDWSGLWPDEPFKTIQHAIDVATREDYFLKDRSVVINVAEGMYDSGASIDFSLGPSGFVSLRGVGAKTVICPKKFPMFDVRNTILEVNDMSWATPTLPNGLPSPLFEARNHSVIAFKPSGVA